MMGHDSGSHPDVMVKKGISFVSISVNGPMLCYNGPNLHGLVSNLALLF